MTSIKMIEGKDKVFFGTRKSDGRKIWLTKPTWDCGWYWSFGYLGNRDEHFHLDGYNNAGDVPSNRSMKDALEQDYSLAAPIAENLWQFCEQAQTIYTMKKAAEVLGRGGSHYTEHALKDVVKDTTVTAHINGTQLPALLQAFWQLVGGVEEAKDTNPAWWDMLDVNAVHARKHVLSMAREHLEHHQEAVAALSSSTPPEMRAAAKAKLARAKDDYTDEHNEEYDYLDDITCALEKLRAMDCEATR